jgi:Four helix bundle sensory module for signal transduction
MFSEPKHDESMLRQLKVMVVVLVLSNIALGAFSFYFLRAIDRKYSDLIDRTVPTLSDMQTLAAVSMDAMRSTNPILFSDTTQSRTDGAQQAHTALQRDRELRENILKRKWLSAETPERKDFRDAGENFTRLANDVIGLLEAGQSTDARERREKSLRPAFNHYVTSMKEAADALGEQSLKTSDLFTANTVKISKVMLGLGSWPVVIMGVFLTITAVFIIVVLLKTLVFRDEAT